ncbi:glycosyltransferase family 117 protein [Pedobacter nutrimenti]|uniref:Drug/metabolite transporter (DMT)-like permease n=1 Tax=Pedobacter nutrimenti TaxID=1241337 RepID=A0A318UAU6_9SPHI|nr:DUF2723 domain-containing protein [Pedobacter nutrimenti]PYF68907.1 drug/metabolite transporter (DMT)-like permease [Pedobacter nutrimenti]
MNNAQRINNLLGFTFFGTALIVYGLTMEPTMSFWDCGEFISAAYKLQVGHQPGAPLFLMIGKAFSLLSAGNTAKVAYWTNFVSVVASAATIMFLFWTITALAARIKPGEAKTDVWARLAAGGIGALAFTFSDTFWFSAVESEVYALSMLFTAIAFWAILKWERTMEDRWLVFIALMIGLSIGVHLLSLLTIPAVVLVYYFKKANSVNWKGVLKAFVLGCAILGFVQFFLIQYLVLLAAKSDLFFVNVLGFAFGSGAAFFMLLLAAGLTAGIVFSVKKRKYNLNLGLLCLTCVLMGFSSYFLILIRANAKTNLNLSNPDNAFSLYNYLGRTNYEATPLLYGQSFDSKVVDNTVTGSTYRKGKEKYEESGKTYKTIYDKNELFPRMYSSRADHVQFYQQWANLAEGEHPTFWTNLGFFNSYQMGFMYWRYFLWNFAGKQNDQQSQGGVQDGNWISGISAVDQHRLGSQKGLPESVLKNEGHNVFYALPLILGLIGMVYVFRKNKAVSIVLAVLFFCTGLAIILYLNQDPLQVRERDYAYVGSFYAFAIWIGLGVLGLKELAGRWAAPKWSLAMAVLVALLVPFLMGSQGWDDHNRSGKTTALTLAKNYLNSCEKNAILFVTADNDTFPLWYAQEVEGFRTDVRVVNIQYLADASYISQMKKHLGNAAALPISMKADTYKEGVRDILPYVDYGLKDSVELKDLFAVLTSDQKEDQIEMNDGTLSNFMPARKLKLSIDKEKLLKSGAFKKADEAKLAPVMEWAFTKKYLTKPDLAILDILLHNDWKRPVYFETSVSQDTYMGLDNYLYLEGYAYRLLPYKRANEKDTKEERSNSDVMYANVMNKMDFSGFKKAAYLDPESRRVVEQTWRLNNTLAENLLKEGKKEAAHRLMVKSVNELPLKKYSIRDTLTRFYTINNLYNQGDQLRANKMTRQTVDFIQQELMYMSTLKPEFQQDYVPDIQLGLSVMNELAKLTAGHKEIEISGQIGRQLKNLQQKFTQG